MTLALCSRAWQAEAAHDGRLSPADLASFERHQRTCSVCAAETRALTALRATALRATDDGLGEVSTLEHRRRRIALLRRANEIVLGQRRSLRRTVVAIFAVTAPLALWLWLRALEDPTVIHTPTYRLTASPAAVWRTVERTATLRLALKDGRFELAVDKLLPSQRFLLELPDGELEVKGTRFVVELEGAGTRGVRVAEGRVELRLTDHGVISLRAGESWPRRTPATEVPTPSPLSPPMTAPAPDAASAKVPPALDAASAKVPPSVGPAAILPGENARKGATASTFAAAMAAFSAGNYGRAEVLFTAFERENAGDARVEDATFLRVVSRAKRGDTDGARAIAREYLRRYPAGLRRAEAERLAR